MPTRTDTRHARGEDAEAVGQLVLDMGEAAPARRLSIDTLARRRRGGRIADV